MATIRTELPSTLPDVAPPAARSLVRWISAVAIALAVSLSITDALNLAFFTREQGDLRAGIIAAALAIPLHVRHLIYGVRGERPPAGAWTLGALAIVMAGGAYFAGDAWVREFTLLAVSILIVVPGRWSYVLAAAIVIAPLFIIGTEWYQQDAPMAGVYVSFAILWRSVTQIVPLRLLAALRALDSASKELEARAVVQVRVKIDTELRNGVGATLQQIVARGERALAALDRNSADALRELRDLVRESRRGLTDARRVVGKYRGSSLRAEIDAAAALLEASGAKVRVVVEDDVSLDSPDMQSRGTIRSAVADALLAEPHAKYAMHVTRDGERGVVVRVSADDAVDGTEKNT